MGALSWILAGFLVGYLDVRFLTALFGKNADGEKLDEGIRLLTDMLYYLYFGFVGFVGGWLVTQLGIGDPHSFGVSNTVNIAGALAFAVASTATLRILKWILRMVSESGS